MGSEMCIRDRYDIRCPSCGGELSPVRMFNLMFVTSIGAARENRAYARPETAQGMFVSFNRVVRTMHPKLPFAIVQVGKAYRNEISPRQGLLRVREFDQMEAEIFVHPEEINNHPRYYLRENRKLRLYPANYQREGKDEILEITAGEAVRRGIIHNQFLAYYLHVATEFLRKLGIPDEAIRCRQQLEDERAHYSRDTWDVEVLTSYGWVEVAGHAYRTDYDLKSHMRISGRDLRYFVSYDKPQVKKIKKAVPDKKKIGQEFRERARDIMKMIEEKQQDILSGSDVRVDIDGKEIDLSEYVTVKEVEERVSGERIVPHVVEPSYGVGRILWCVLEHAYREEDDRVYLSLPPWLSPIDCAVLPLVSKDGMPERAMEIADMLKKRGLYVVYDESGSVGRRYARYDEIGVSFAVTVDSQTLSDNTVTVRERDSRKQVRVKIDELADKLRKLLSGEEDV